MTAGSAVAVGMFGLAGGSLLIAPSAAVAAGHATGVAACAQAKYTFVEAVSATNHADITKVKAHPAKFHCGGEDDGHYSTSHVKETLTLHANSVVRVFKNPENPSVSKLIEPSALPHWLKHNRSEPIYRIKGHTSDITTMAEEFHP